MIFGQPEIGPPLVLLIKKWIFDILVFGCCSTVVFRYQITDFWPARHWTPYSAYKTHAFSTFLLFGVVAPLFFVMKPAGPPGANRRRGNVSWEVLGCS